MEVYLIRHGIAEDRVLYPTDEERPLTTLGKKKTKKVAQRLSKLGLHFDIILTSPLTRALETARLLEKRGLTAQLEEFPPLSPEGDIKLWLDWYSVKEYHCIALIGHQPDLGNWAEILAWGQSQEKLILKKAGLIGLKLPKEGNPIGQSQLFLLTSPKWFI